MLDDWKCSEHGLPRVSSCSWCSEPICRDCIEASGLKKYCPKCYTKISKNSLASTFRQRPERNPDEKIMNIDTSLSEEDIKLYRKKLEAKEKANKGWDGAKNRNI
ncbi:hypothetical protein ACFLTH_05520 [Bacteroidota bacterium]